ncbi:MAG: hypothetical protein FWE10_03645 [Rikenellaceae bacterium]|nr:hypothetical protein [Rikenellaceae bacterium]MCL2693020.1 hypothetical protein [Rikenellaceae bacterium]
MNNLILRAAALLLIFTTLSMSAGCKKSELECPPTVDTPPDGSRITVSGIVGVPSDVVISKLRAEITGFDWQVIATVEAEFVDNKGTLELPTEFEYEQLQKAVRDNDRDYEGHWRAMADDPDARVAALGDILAYNTEGKVVGRVFLTDWPGTGSSVGKSFIYYHYTDRPLSLSGTFGSFRHELSFAQGWNVYANRNLVADPGPGTILRTTSIAPDAPQFEWRFEPRK